MFFSLIAKHPCRDDEAIVTLYHEIGEIASDYCVKDSTFNQQIDYLVDADINWILASEFAQTLGQF